MRKASISVLLAVLSLTSVFPVGAQNAASNYPYEAAVSYLQEEGIVDYSSNVRIGDPVNRAEALKVILKSVPQLEGELRSLGSSLSPISLFPDVHQSAWYASYVELGFTKGIVKGYPDGFLRPEANVKVAEAIAMVTRAFGEKTAQTEFRTSADLPNQQAQWFTGPVSTVLARNAIKPGSRLNLSAPMTRGQLMDLVYRMREVHAKSIPAFISPSGTDASISNGTSSNPAFNSIKPFSITIPTLGINDMTVTHPTDPFTQKGVLEPLNVGLGHLLGFPGEGSKVMIYGHSSNVPWDLSEYSKIFRTINQMNIGDRVYVAYEGKQFTYQVTEKRTVNVNDTTPYQENDRGEELILYTCWPPDTIDQRYLVFASPVQ